MAVSEPDRHELYQTLERVLGKGPTDTMMSLLPPVGWADVATKEDLRLTTEVLTTRMDSFEREMRALIGSMESRINERIVRTVVAVNIPAIFAAVGLTLAAARLA